MVLEPSLASRALIKSASCQTKFVLIIIVLLLSLLRLDLILSLVMEFLALVPTP